MTNVRSSFVLLLAALFTAMSFTGSVTLAMGQDVKPLKALLVIGGCCHDYEKQKDVLKEELEKRINVEVTIAYDPAKGTNHLNPVYESADWAKGYDVVIHDECSAGIADLDTIERILKPHREGLPAVALHCALHCFRSEGWKEPKTPTPWQQFMGLQSSGHGPQKPIMVSYNDSDHSITKGLTPWVTGKEELYNNFAGGVLPTAHVLSNGEQGGKEAIVTWTNTFDGKSKVFATTLGHNTQTVADTRYMDLVARGLLWSCGKLNDDGTPMEGYAAK